MNGEGVQRPSMRDVIFDTSTVSVLPDVDGPHWEPLTWIATSAISASIGVDPLGDTVEYMAVYASCSDFLRGMKMQEPAIAALAAETLIELLNGGSFDFAQSTRDLPIEQQVQHAVETIAQSLAMAVVVLQVASRLDLDVYPWQKRLVAVPVRVQQP